MSIKRFFLLFDHDNELQTGGFQMSDMKLRVISLAGKVWTVLGEKGASTIPALAKNLKERDDIVNQAIGWLAREDKIKYVRKGTRTYISLVDTEQDMYNLVKPASAIVKPKTKRRAKTLK